MESTERLALPLLSPGQAQKEFFHNEALLLLDSIVFAAVEELPRNDPPQSPVSGSAYLVGTSPAGEWSGFADYFAAFTSAGWRYIAPVDGLRALVKSTGATAEYSAGGWQIGLIRGSQLLIDGIQVVGNQAPAVDDPAGGSNVDAEARGAISQVLNALRQHGLIST